MDPCKPYDFLHDFLHKFIIIMLNCRTVDLIIPFSSIEYLFLCAVIKRKLLCKILIHYLNGGLFATLVNLET